MVGLDWTGLVLLVERTQEQTSTQAFRDVTSLRVVDHHAPVRWYSRPGTLRRNCQLT